MKNQTFNEVEIKLSNHQYFTGIYVSKFKHEWEFALWLSEADCKFVKL
jgi:hypothetical protein